MRSRGSHLTLAVIAASMLQSDIRGAGSFGPAGTGR